MSSTRSTRLQTVEPADQLAGGSASDRPDRRRSLRVGRSRLIGVAAAVGALALVASTWIVATRIRSPEQVAADAAPPLASWVTAPAEFRTLATSVVFRGDVTADGSLTLGVPSSTAGDGTPVVTGVFAARGDLVDAGARVLEVAGRPVFVFEGTTPAYRTMRPAMSGTDIAQLQAALADTGCDGGTDGVFSPELQRCVEDLYRTAGYEPAYSPETYRADLAQADRDISDAQTGIDQANLGLATATAPPPRSTLLAVTASRDAAQRAVDDAIAAGDDATAAAQADIDERQGAVDALEADPDASPTELADARSALDAATIELERVTRETATALTDARDALTVAQASLDEATAPADAAAERLAVEQAQQRLADARSRREDLTTTTGVSVPEGEILFVPSLPARVASIIASVGPATTDPSTGASGLAVLDIGTLYVQAVIPTALASSLATGATVEILDETTGTTIAGSVTSIGDQPVTGANGATGSPVRIDVDGGLDPQWQGRNVRVTLDTDSTGEPALIVPVAAVSAGTDGQPRVQTLDTAGEPVDVAVTAGLSADGFIAVTPTEPDALRTGDQVVIGR